MSPLPFEGTISGELCILGLVVKPGTRWHVCLRMQESGNHLPHPDRLFLTKTLPVGTQN